MSKYKNIKEFLESHFSVITTLEDFYKTKKIEFECIICNYINSLSSSSYSNKKCKVSLEDFCTNCKKKKELYLQKKEFIDKIKISCGHIVKDINFSTRKVIYECFTCKKDRNTFIPNLERANYPGVCGSCQNNKNKLEFEYIKSIVESHDMVLVTKPNEYENNKQKLKLLCKCGKSYEAILSDIKKDKHCQTCKLDKCKKTCLEKYGEDNVSKVHEIYEKIVKTSFTRKYFEFPISKKVLYIQGYEPQAILYLLNREIDPFLEIKIKETDIIVGKDIKRFHYIDENKVEHVYFPDIQIKNHIIEVKSVYTFYKEYQKNYLKCNSVIDNNFILRLMIYNQQILYEFICKTKDELEKMFNDINSLLK